MNALCKGELTLALLVASIGAVAQQPDPFDCEAHRRVSTLASHAGRVPCSNVRSGNDRESIHKHGGIDGYCGSRRYGATLCAIFSNSAPLNGMPLRKAAHEPPGSG